MKCDSLDRHIVNITRLTGARLRDSLEDYLKSHTLPVLYSLA
jgi:hypothetical protein